MRFSWKGDDAIGDEEWYRVRGNDGRGYVMLSGSALIHLEVSSLLQSGMYVISQYLHFPLGLEFTEE